MVLFLVGASSLPATAEIDSLSPESATVIQGGIVTASVSLGQAGGCVTASSPEITILVTVLPGCLLADHVVTIVTTVLTPPGVYSITFQERPLLGGPMLGSAQFTLTVNPLIAADPPTTTTTTLVAEPGQPPTTTTTRVEVTITTTTSPAPTTTTTPGPPLAPPTTVPTGPPSPTTTTTPAATGEDPPGGGGTPEATTTTTTTTVPEVVEEDDGDDLGGGGGSRTPDNGSNLPPPPEPVGAAEEPQGIRSFLDPFLPEVVADTIMSPIYVLRSILGAVFATGTRAALGGLVAIAYAAYLMRRWWTPQKPDHEGQPA